MKFSGHQIILLKQPTTEEKKVVFGLVLKTFLLIDFLF